MLMNVLRAVGAAGAVGGAVALAATTTECAAGASPPIYLGRWFDGWAKGRTSFHKKDVHPTLLKYSDKILPADAVLVPLCGKTVDLGWLAAQPGTDVVIGTEAVEQAMVQLQEDPGNVLGFQKIPKGDAVRPPRFTGWAGGVMKTGSTSVGRVVVLEGDHLVLDSVDLPAFKSSAEMPQVSAVWDRASLVAMRPQDRQRYVEVYDRVVAPNGKILLVVLSYDQTAATGPPWAVPEADVHALFSSPTWTVEKLDKNPTEVGKFKNVEVHEEVYLITKQGSK